VRYESTIPASEKAFNNMSSFSYKIYLDETVDRHRQLWNRRMPNGILAAVMSVDELPFIDPNMQCPHIPSMFDAWEHNYRLRRGIHDDLVPVARVSYGSAAFGAFLGAEISFETGIGWSYPFLDSYEDINTLAYDPSNEWIVRQAEACKYFVEGAAGKFPLCEMEPNDGLNLVEALRGSEAYTDVYDHPDGVHQLLAFASEFNIRFMNMQREILAPNLYYQDGIFSMFRMWLPGKTPWMSIDAYGNCSPGIFRTFGAPYLQRMIDYYGGGWIHIHSHALHLIPEVVKMPRVVGIGVADDPNAERGFDQLEDIRKITRDIPLQIDCNALDLLEEMAAGTLPGGVMYMVREGIETVSQANRLMEQARAYRSVG
jgi:hypothetical protein